MLKLSRRQRVRAPRIIRPFVCPPTPVTKDLNPDILALSPHGTLQSLLCPRLALAGEFLVESLSYSVPIDLPVI